GRRKGITTTERGAEMDWSDNGIRSDSFRLVEKSRLSEAVQLFRLEGDCSAVKAPGQFVSLTVPGHFLRRPFSVCDWGDGWLTLLIQRVGTGTEELQRLPVGTELDLLTGLGRGFDLSAAGRMPLLVGGGSGLSPLAGLSRRLAEHGIRPKVLLGFREKTERFGAGFFPGAEVRYAADVFEELEQTEHDSFFGCGSMEMMQELCSRDPAPGQVAFDVRMGCGFGACMGCSIPTRDGMKRVCKDGPVFRKEELVWES
ncbi:MAG: dihydroorotate dehydrogenase electron transfer subunit, partial [Oscillospiraceae bacterium]|nr:dihydroorotate dehydrogenase electron transfer subunit [Oscillospiraceae bacterium]